MSYRFSRMSMFGFSLNTTFLNKVHFCVLLKENKMNTLDDLALTVCGLTSEGVRMLLKEDKRQGMIEEGKLPELVDHEAVVSELVDNAVQNTNIALSKVLNKN